MLIKCKVKLFSRGFEPEASTAYVNGNHVGFVGPLEWDEATTRVKDAPMSCPVEIDGQSRHLLFKDKAEYEDFVEQVQHTICAFIPRL